jgi:hypothetical protein
MGNCATQLENLPISDRRNFPLYSAMTKKPHTKILRVGMYLAEVDIELIKTADEWSPYLSLQDAEKIDQVRAALLQDDLKTASQFARIYQLTAIAA